MWHVGGRPSDGSKFSSPAAGCPPNACGTLKMLSEPAAEKNSPAVALRGVSRDCMPVVCSGAPLSRQCWMLKIFFAIVRIKQMTPTPQLGAEHRAGAYCNSCHLKSAQDVACWRAPLRWLKIFFARRFECTALTAELVRIDGAGLGSTQNGPSNYPRDTPKPHFTLEICSQSQKKSRASAGFAGRRSSFTWF